MNTPVYFLYGILALAVLALIVNIRFKLPKKVFLGLAVAILVSMHRLIQPGPGFKTGTGLLQVHGHKEDPDSDEQQKNRIPERNPVNDRQFPDHILCLILAEIADPLHRVNQLGVKSVVDLLSQMVDVNINDIRCSFIIIIPDVGTDRV